MKNPLAYPPRMSAALVLTTLLMTGCGAWQSAKDTSVDTSRAIFVAKVKKMHLAIDGHAELNRDALGASLPVVLRVYQLKDAKAFETATYTQLLDDADHVLKADALHSTEVVLGPDTTVTLNAPMAADAQVVGIVAFFRDTAHAEWQRVIPTSQWKQTDPVKVSVIDNKMELEQ